MKKIIYSFLVVVFLQLVTSQATLAAISSAEREALIAIYNSSDGANWKKNSGWLGAAGTECSWYGVTCAPFYNNYVFALTLNRNNLNGTIPPAIGNLTKMISLRLQDNQLSGEIPSEFIKLTSLNRFFLNLANNSLYTNNTALSDFISSKEVDLDWFRNQIIVPAPLDPPITPSLPVVSIPLSQTQVSQLYIAIFGRASEGEGNLYWQNDKNSTSMTVTAGLMLATGAAESYFGTTLNKNVDFITHIYLNTLGKTYDEDPEGVNYWVSELEGGKSKGNVVAALISAAQHPDNWGPAQDRFKNKVAVSDYCADTIAKYTDNLEIFKRFIDVITDDETTVNEAKGLIETEGDYFTEVGDDDENEVAEEGEEPLSPTPINDDTLIVFEKWLKKAPDPENPNTTTYSNPELWLVKSDGSNLQRLTQGYFDSEPEWSADGKTIAFTRASIGGVIKGPFTIKVDGSELTQAYNRGGHYPEWIDSNSLLYTAGFPWGAYIVSLDTQQATKIDFGISDTFTHRISPDGQSIAFSGPADASQKRPIYVGDINGNNVTALQTTDGPLTGYLKKWENEGLYATSTNEGSCIRIDLINAFYQTVEEVSGIDECNLSYSPSAEKIVYQYNNDIWVMSADGQNKTRIVDGGASHLREPQWSAN